MQKELLRKYFALKARIEQAIPEDNLAELREYDQKLGETWTEILSCQPGNREERLILATFLIDQIEPNRHSPTILDQIRKKLLELL